MTVETYVTKAPRFVPLPNTVIFRRLVHSPTLLLMGTYNTVRWHSYINKAWNFKGPTTSLVSMRSAYMYPYSSIPEGIDGEFELVFGTSAASPVVGSIFTLVNDARIAVGKRSLGFLNPLVSRLAPVVIVKKPNVTSEKIYSDLFKPAFNDITSGGNQGCGKSSQYFQRTLLSKGCFRYTWVYCVSTVSIQWTSYYQPYHSTTGWDPVTGM